MRKEKYLEYSFYLTYQWTDIEKFIDIEKEGVIMDSLIIGLIVVLALAYIGFKFYKQMSGKGGCGCGSDSGSSKSSSCGGCCGCDSNQNLGIKRADK